MFQRTMLTALSFAFLFTFTAAARPDDGWTRSSRPRSAWPTFIDTSGSRVVPITRLVSTNNRQPPGDDQIESPSDIIIEPFPPMPNQPSEEQRGVPPAARRTTVPATGQYQYAVPGCYGVTERWNTPVCMPRPMPIAPCCCCACCAVYYYAY